jgi:hypothetical protein
MPDIEVLEFDLGTSDNISGQQTLSDAIGVGHDLEHVGNSGQGDGRSTVHFFAQVADIGFEKAVNIIVRSFKTVIGEDLLGDECVGATGQFHRPERTRDAKFGFERSDESPFACTG